MKRLYFFEGFVLANLVLVAIVARTTSFLISDALRTFGALFLAIATQVAIGIGVRIVIAMVTKKRGYLRRLKRRVWLIDTLRLTFATTLMIFTYGWLKVAVPLLRTFNADLALWNLDSLFGFAPSVLLLDLFARAGALRFIDWSYANVFYASMLVALAFFFSHPSRRVRIAFANGNVALWLAGAWLYFALPSLGPAYRFPDLWFPYADSLRITQNLQAMLMRNWMDSARAAANQPHGPISIALGIAAFPSLHVGFQTYVFFWMRRLWTSGQILFAVFALVIFLGSMITGWHYLVDGVAGVLMAWLAFRFSNRDGLPNSRPL